MLAPHHPEGDPEGAPSPPGKRAGEASGVDYSDLPHASRVLFESDVVQIGATRCPADHPDFERPGAIQRHAFYLGGSPVRVLRHGRRTFLADSTTVSYHHRGEEIERRAVEDGGDFSNWFAVQPDYLLSALEEIDPDVGVRPDRPFLAAEGPCPAHSYLTQRLLVSALSGPTPPDALTIEEAALGLLTDVARAAAGVRAIDPAPRVTDDTDARHGALVEAVKDLLIETFHAPLTLAEVAAAVGCSPYHLARIFRAQTGWTLHGFRTQLRVRAAASAVLAGEEDLTQLALRLGFSSHSHLSTSFRKAFGVAPSALRRGALRTLESLRQPGRR